MPHSDPERRKQYHKAWRERQKAKRLAGIAAPPGVNPVNPAGGPLPPVPPDFGIRLQPAPLATARDILGCVREQINDCRADRATSVQARARTIGFLAQVALKAVEVTDLADRVAALEANVS
jgi:hypothetical protein